MYTACVVAAHSTLANKMVQNVAYSCGSMHAFLFTGVGSWNLEKR